MAYVPVPKDLSTVQTKVMFNLTRRQLICFSLAAVVGIPLFFLCRRAMSPSAATIVMVLVIMPFFLLAMYSKHGQPLEKIIRNMIQVCFIRPKVRPYMTNNFYSVLLRQDKLDQEVYLIVHKGKAKPKTHPKRKEGNSK